MKVIDTKDQARFGLCPSDLGSLLAGKTVTGQLNSRNSARMRMCRGSQIKIAYPQRSAASIAELCAYVPRQVVETLFQGKNYTGLTVSGKPVYFETNRNL